MGSLMMRSTSRPAILPASRVAWRWRVVEVGGDGDHRLGELLAHRLVGEGLDLPQDEGGDLLRAVLLVADQDLDVAVAGRHQRVGEHLPRPLHLLGVVLAADQPLDGEDGVVRVGDRLALGDLPDQPIAVLGEADDRRGGTASLAVGDHLRRAALHDGGAAVGSAEVDTENFRHWPLHGRASGRGRLALSSGLTAPATSPPASPPAPEPAAAACRGGCSPAAARRARSAR